jgi:hypothetical protein
MAKKQGEDTYSYKGWIISDSFFKRMLAIMGYNMVGGLLIYAVFFILLLIIIFLAAIVGFVVSPTA